MIPACLLVFLLRVFPSVIMADSRWLSEGGMCKGCQSSRGQDMGSRTVL